MADYQVRSGRFTAWGWCRVALISGFLRQTCKWTPRGSEFDDYGNPIAQPAVTIKCRWEYKSGWVRGVMGMTETSQGYQSYRHKVYVDQAVSAGDTLEYTDPNGKVVSGPVLAVESTVGMGGREEARVCYV